MTDEEKQKLIENYLAAAERIQQQQSKQKQHHENLVQDKKIFEQVVEEIGVSPEDQAELKQIAEDALNAAQEFFFKNDIEKCIQKAKLAHQLLPYDLRPLELLLRIYSQNEAVKDDATALVYAQRLMAIEPKHKVALAFIGGEQTTKSPLFHPLLLVVFVLLLTIVGLIVTRSPAPEGQPVESTAVVKQPPTQKTTSVPSKPLGKPLDKPPITFVNNPVKNLIITDRGSKFSLYKDSFSYTFKAVMTNNSDKEIRQVKVFVSLLDKDGKTISKKKFDVRASYQPPLRKGESAPLSGLLYQDHLPENYQHPQSIEVSFDTLEALPTAAHISKADAKLHWPDKPLDQFQLKLKARNSSPSQGILKKWRWAQAYEVTNEGQGIITGLKLKLETLDAAGKVVGHNESYVTSSGDAYINPGETWLAFFIVSSDEQPVKTKVSIVSVQ